MTARQQLICDLVNRFEERYQYDFEDHQRIIKQRRAKLVDKKTGKTKDNRSRAAASFPVRLFNWIDVALDNPKFMDNSEFAEKELRWLVKKFPQYRIPYEY